MTNSYKGAPSRRQVIKAAGAVAAGITAPAILRVHSAFAAYPERPLRIVVANTPGGPSDIIARIMAAAMQETMGGSVFVENKGVSTKSCHTIRSRTSRRFASSRCRRMCSR